MKKIIIAGLIASLFLVGITSLRMVSAKDKPSDNPFQAILDAISKLKTDIQKQINTIQLIPGLTGPAGPAGHSALITKIIDSTGALVGYPMGISDIRPIIYDPGLQALESWSIFADEIDSLDPGPIDLLYATTNCSGQAYARNIAGTLPLLKYIPHVGPVEFYLPDKTKSVAPPNTYIVKGRRTAGSECVTPPTDVMNSTFDFPVNQITLPYTPPFDIVVQ